MRSFGLDKTLEGTGETASAFRFVQGTSIPMDAIVPVVGVEVGRSLRAMDTLTLRFHNLSVFENETSRHVSTLQMYLG